MMTSFNIKVELSWHKIDTYTIKYLNQLECCNLREQHVFKPKLLLTNIFPTNQLQDDLFYHIIISSIFYGIYDLFGIASKIS